MILHRRKFLMGLGALMAAPAIVSVSNIMPVKAMPSADMLQELLRQRIANAERILARDLSQLIYGDDSQAANMGLSRLVDESTGDIYLRGGQDHWQWKPYSVGITVTA
jgi:hypothetical protein